MENYGGLLAFSFGLALLLRWEWLRRRRDRRVKFLKNLREVLGPDIE